MTTLQRLLLSFSLLAIFNVQASEELPTSQSLDFPASSTEHQPSEDFSQAAEAIAEIRQQPDENQTLYYSQPWLEIYDAYVQRYRDHDYDGYASGISVTFDVDTYNSYESIYARLYLRHESSSVWYHYTTSQVFTIHYDDYADRYTVDTELLEGFPPGSYSLLIEIYSISNDFYPVTSMQLYYDDFGNPLLLEDRQHDVSSGGYDYHIETISHGHIGSLTGSTVIAILLLLGARVYTDRFNRRGTKRTPKHIHIDNNCLRHKGREFLQIRFGKQ